MSVVVNVSRSQTTGKAVFQVTLDRYTFLPAEIQTQSDTDTYDTSGDETTSVYLIPSLASCGANNFVLSIRWLH